MRIAVLHSFYDESSPSGENAVVQEQVRMLSQAGHQVDLVSRHTSDVNFGSRALIRTALNVATGIGPDPRERFDAFDPDIILCHNTFPNWGTRWLKEYGSRTVVTLHNYRALCAAATLYRDGESCELCPSSSSLHAIAHRCYRGRVSTTLPLSIATRGSGRASPIVQLAAVRIVLNGTAERVFRKYYPQLDFVVLPNAIQAAKTPSSTSQRTGWMYAGRLTTEKGVAYLRKHWPREEALRIAGDGPLRSAVQEMAEAEPTTFTYLGTISRPELRAQLQTSEGLILPSLWSEGLPTVLIESLATGTPVLASNRCDAGRQPQLRSAMTTFDAEDGGPGLVQAMRRTRADVLDGTLQPRAVFEKEYSPDVWLERMESVFQEVRSKSK